MEFPLLNSRVSLDITNVTNFIHSLSGVYMSIPSSQFILPFHPPLGRSSFVGQTRTHESPLFPGTSHSVQLLSRAQLFVTPWTTACQAFHSFTNSQSLLKIMSIESVMPSNHLILFHPLLLLPSIFPSIRVFSSKSPLCIRWPKY